MGLHGNWKPLLKELYGASFLKALPYEPSDTNSSSSNSGGNSSDGNNNNNESYKKHCQVMLIDFLPLIFGKSKKILTGEHFMNFVFKFIRDFFNQGGDTCAILIDELQFVPLAKAPTQSERDKYAKPLSEAELGLPATGPREVMSHGPLIHQDWHRVMANRSLRAEIFRYFERNFLREFFDKIKEKTWRQWGCRRGKADRADPLCLKRIIVDGGQEYPHPYIIGSDGSVTGMPSWKNCIGESDLKILYYVNHVFPKQNILVHTIDSDLIRILLAGTSLRLDPTTGEPRNYVLLRLNDAKIKIPKGGSVKAGGEELEKPKPKPKRGRPKATAKTEKEGKESDKEKEKETKPRPRRRTSKTDTEIKEEATTSAPVTKKPRGRPKKTSSIKKEEEPKETEELKKEEKEHENEKEKEQEKEGEKTADKEPVINTEKETPEREKEDKANEEVKENENESEQETKSENGEKEQETDKEKEKEKEKEEEYDIIYEKDFVDINSLWRQVIDHWQLACPSITDPIMQLVVLMTLGGDDFVKNLPNVGAKIMHDVYLRNVNSIGPLVTMHNHAIDAIASVELDTDALWRYTYAHKMKSHLVGREELPSYEELAELSKVTFKRPAYHCLPAQEVEATFRRVRWTLLYILNGGNKNFPVPDCMEKDKEGLSLHGWELDETRQDNKTEEGSNEKEATTKNSRALRRKVVRAKLVSPVTDYTIPTRSPFIEDGEEKEEQDSNTNNKSWLYVGVAVASLSILAGVGYYLYVKRKD